jgi:hypothetical protein
MIEYINWIGEWAALLVTYPLIGLVVVIAGWSLGEVVQRPSMTNWESFNKYIQLFILGFITVAIARGGFAASFWQLE